MLGWRGIFSTWLDVVGVSLLSIGSTFITRGVDVDGLFVVLILFVTGMIKGRGERIRGVIAFSEDVSKNARLVVLSILSPLIDGSSFSEANGNGITVVEFWIFGLEIEPSALSFSRIIVRDTEFEFLILVAWVSLPQQSSTKQKLK